MLFLHNPRSLGDRLPAPPVEVSSSVPVAASVGPMLPVTRITAAASFRWHPFDDAADYGIIDAPGVYRLAMPHSAEVLTSEAGTLTPVDTAATVWASARLQDHAASLTITHGAVTPVPSTPGRLRAARRLLASVGTLPGRVAFEALDMRSRVEAHLTAVLVRGFAFNTSTTVDLLAEVGVSADAGIVAALRLGGTYEPDELGAPIDRKEVEDAAQAAEEASIAERERSAALVTTEYTGEELGCTFLVQANIGADVRIIPVTDDIIAQVRDMTTGIKVANLPNGEALYACKTVGLAWEAGPLVTKGRKTFMRIAAPDERFALTRGEVTVAKCAPVLIGRHALLAWRDMREIGRPMADSDFVKPRTPEWSAALDVAERVLDELVPPYVRQDIGVLPVDQACVRGLCLPPDVAAHAIVKAFARHGGQRHVFFGRFDAALACCLGAAASGVVTIGELTPKDPGIFRRLVGDKHKDAIRKYISGKPYASLAELVQVMRDAGDTTAEQPRFYGRITAICNQLGYENDERMVDGVRRSGYWPKRAKKGAVA
jgi:hypothetical protein